MSEREVCPMCHSSENGCTVLEEGSRCRGPRQPLPGAWTPETHAAVSRMRREAGAPGIVVFDVPAGTPVVACRRCGLAIVWIELPTGGRLSLTSSTREPHDATCAGLP